MRAFTLALLLGTLAAPAAAEEPNSRAFSNDRIERVAFILGVAAYVQDNCQEIRPDWKAARVAAAANNIGSGDVNKPPLGDAIRKQVADWAKVPASRSCRTIEQMFGPEGSIIEGLVLRGG